ncbi:unnamed protein product [Rotaria sp. Silwood1]|nr:unnamed protein product [Rotaria sp. Silwood1]CAF1076787.1 unnamed protein product [Rotaria sp. Silwood1]
MIAKHTDASVPFGNINVMFSGDFLQFAPVRNMALYSDVISPITDTNDSEKQIKDKNTQRQIQYRVERALWTHVNTVVTLTRQMRVEDPDFLAIQNHIHFGNGTVEDHKKLCTRIVSPLNDLKNLNDMERKKSCHACVSQLFKNEIKQCL